MVGTDIEAGTYKTTGPPRPGDFWHGCYYARLSSTDGESGSILANGNFEGPNTVTVKASDAAFEAPVIACGRRWADVRSICLRCG